jgi:hypothetical protein
MQANASPAKFDGEGGASDHSIDSNGNMALATHEGFFCQRRGSKPSKNISCSDLASNYAVQSMGGTSAATPLSSGSAGGVSNTAGASATVGDSSCSSSTAPVTTR